MIIVVFFSLLYRQEGVFQGLIPILNCYLENMEVDVDTRCTILNYLKLIKKRASGKLALKFLISHKYNQSLCSFDSKHNSYVLLEQVT